MAHSPCKVVKWLIFGLWFTGCAVNKPFYGREPGITGPPQSRLLHSVFLIGDTGLTEPDKSHSPLEVLTEKLMEAGEKSTVVFLGDNLYPDGLPEAGDKHRRKAEQGLLAQLEILEQYSGRVVFIPGNHDWSSSGPDGLKAVGRMERFIESRMDRGNVFLPDSGFPGPVELKLMDKDEDAALTRDIRLVLLDTQWWLHPYEKSFGDTGEYELHDSNDFWDQLTNLMRDRQNDHLIVAGHHPLFSNGVNGGNFPLKRHLLPPVAGTGYVLYRKLFGLPQDISHSRYQILKRGLLDLFKDAESLVYAAGHDHILQHNIQKGRRTTQHYVVSGTASMVDYAVKGKGANFVARDRGFAVVKYYADRSSWLEFWNAAGELLYRRQLLAPTDNPFLVSRETASTAVPELRGRSTTVAANPKYDEAGWLRRTLLGSHNRRLWSIPVEAPFFDISGVAGGLEPVKLGGTGQSTTLRLSDSRGRTYVLRSIDKEAGRVWDPTLKKTVARDLAQDQFSIVNPYGAFMMPVLAEAAGLFHTKPELYAVPQDPRLGRFSELMQGKLALFEERPDDDMSDFPHLGGSGEVLSTRDLLREVDGDIDHRVDQHMMLRNRLLDMLVADWDRHEDQWRWASFEPSDEEGKIYRPIPRDRDMAFIVMNGLLPTVGKITFFYNYQDFRRTYGNLKGLTSNSLDLTRRFTNRLTKSEWKAVADSLSASLTDKVIENAVAQMPPGVAEAEGAAIVRVLKQRRVELPAIALEYYRLVSRVTDVVGSHKREKFIIEAFRGDSVRVQVYKLTSAGQTGRRYYDRTFYPGETRELRLFGLGGDDFFEIARQQSGAIVMRLIGGAGSDDFNGSEDEKPSGRIHIYDNHVGSRFSNVGGMNLHTSAKAEINRYDYEGGFQFNRTEPLLFFGSNRDDGIFLGGGARIIRYGFRKSPAAIHRLHANFAALTQSFNLEYDGYFADIGRGWDAGLDLELLLPNNIRNFYGLGNETSSESRLDDFYQARLWQYQLKPSLRRPVGTGISLSVGPYFQVTEIRQDEGKFIGQPQAGISANTFEDQWFSGLHTSLVLRVIDDEVNPKQGFSWYNEAMLNLGVRNTTANYSTLASSLSMYLSPVFNPQLTVATRLGFRHNIGSFPFYDAQTLGGKETLRGLLSNRYSGRTSFYQNIEMRTKLIDFQNYLLGGEGGVLAFWDYGRVWTDGEHSRRWHYGAGGGLWMSLFKMSVIRASIGFSEGSYNMLIGAGFFF